MGIAFFGLGNFLGGMSEGFAKMSQLEDEKQRTLLEAQAIEQRQQALTQNATQFADSQALAREQMEQSLGISRGNQAIAQQEVNQRAQQMQQNERLAYMQQMEAERAEGRARLDRNKPTSDDAIRRAMLEDLMARYPDAEWTKRLRALLPQMMSGPQSSGAPQATDPGMDGISPYQNFYKGGILGGM